MSATRIKLAVLPLLLSSAAVHAATPSWTVSEISGPVSVGAVGKFRPVARGAMLAAGDVVSTGTGARVVLTRGEEYVIVSPSSRLRLPAAQESQGGVMQWIEDMGTAVFRIQKKATPHFGVRTPYLAAVVKGTTFSVTVGAEGASVQVVEGAVEVSTPDGGAADLIRPGVIASVTADARFRLNVDGDVHRTIESPNKGAGDATPAPASVVADSRPAETLTVAVSDVQPALAELTDGLVKTDSTATAVMASVVGEQTKSPALTTQPAQPSASDSPANPAGNGSTPVATPVEVASAPPPVVTPPPVEVAVLTTPPVSNSGDANANGNNGNANGVSGNGNGAGNNGNGNGNGGSNGGSGNGNGNSGNGNGNGGSNGGSGNGNGNSGNGNGNGGSNGSATDHAGDKAAHDAEEAAKKAAHDAEEAAKRAAKDAEKAARDAKDAKDAKDADKAAKDAAKALEAQLKAQIELAKSLKKGK